MKLLRDPNKSDVEDFAQKQGYTKSKTSTIDIGTQDVLDHRNRYDNDKEEWTIPYGKDEAVHFVREYEAWWNNDWNQCFEDIYDIIDYEFDEWEIYCQDRGIDPQGKIIGD